MNAARINSRYLYRLVCFASAAFAALILAQPLNAEGLAGRFEVRSADLELKDGVYHLNARFDLPISEAVRRGLVEGVPLTLEVDIEIPNGLNPVVSRMPELHYGASGAR